MTSLQNQPSRLHEIDGMRGLAAVLVAITHFYLFFANTQFIPGGALCVDLFFILSGIVLSHVYEADIAATRLPARKFWQHRLARLYPLHLFALAIVFVLHLIHLHITEIAPTLVAHPLAHDEAASTAFSGLMNLLMLQSMGFGADYAWVSPSWSVSVELAVNALWFWILQHTRKSTPILGVLLLALFISLNTGGFTVRPYSENAFGLINYGILRGLIGFMLGVLCYRHAIPHLSLIPRWTANLLAAGATVVTVFTFHVGTGPAVVGSFYVMLVAILPILVLCSMHPQTFLHAFFTRAPLLWLGKISYALYLLHWVIGNCLQSLQNHFALTSKPVMAVLYLGTILPLAALTYRYVEAPARRKINDWGKA